MGEWGRNGAKAGPRESFLCARSINRKSIRINPDYDFFATFYGVRRNHPSLSQYSCGLVGYMNRITNPLVLSGGFIFRKITPPGPGKKYEARCRSTNIKITITPIFFYNHFSKYSGGTLIKSHSFLAIVLISKSIRNFSHVVPKIPPSLGVLCR